MSKNSRSRRVREPEVIVFEEPQYASRTRSGKQAAREREKFLVSRPKEFLKLSSCHATRLINLTFAVGGKRS